MLRLFLRKGKECLSIVLSCINTLIPKQNAILFYNNAIIDNSRCLLEYIAINENMRIECYFKEGDKIRSLPEGRVHYFSSTPLLLLQMMTCKVIVTSFDHRFLIKPTKQQRFIQLWHGTPLKTIGCDINKTKWERRGTYYTDILCPSAFWKETYKRAFGCSINQLRKWDNPRNDLLSSPVRHEHLEKFFEIRYDKLILWMPTFRKSEKLGGTIETEKSIPIINSDNIKMINETLKAAGNLLVIKPHPLQNCLNDILENTSNIKIVTNADLDEYGIELYQLLASSDALITDYSSVFFDYLLLDRPIGFIIEDYDEYRDNRGFTVSDPFALMPGKMIIKDSQLCDFISNPYSEDVLYQEMREKIRKKVSYWNDFSNCKRISSFIGKIMEGE